MKTKHTEGPWELRKSPSKAIVYNVGDTHGNPALTAVYDTMGEGEANAHLIASAPELYEAALTALENLNNRAETQSKWRTGDQKAYEKLEAAISKAEGEATP